jgi:hypothetical protein
VNLFLRTLLPLDANNKGNMSVDGVVGEDAGSLGVGASEADLRVDVQWESGAARRPDNGGEWDGVRDSIVSGDWALEVGLGGNLV